MAHTIKDWISRQMFLRTLGVHRSRLNWREASKYTRHWVKCQEKNARAVMPWSRELAEKFWRDGSVAFNSFELDSFLRAAYQCDYTEFYRKSYRVHWSPERSGSQLYHADGGPGTCIIVMRYDSNVTAEDGPLEVVQWARTRAIFAKEPRMVSRDSLCAWYESQVKPWDRTVYLGRPGHMVAFMNNTLHRGGYPSPGHTRDATVFHFYPSMIGDKAGRVKTEAYPKDPDI